MPQICQAVEAVHKICPNAPLRLARGVPASVKAAALETTATQDHHTASTK